MTTDQHHDESELPPAGNPADASNKDVPPAIAAFVESFYKISDTPDVHEQYADNYYINDESRLSFQIGPMQPTNKRDGIVAWRQQGWQGVTRRKHVVNGVFISPRWENEIMLDGTVEMDKNGSTLKFNWAGRMVFDQKSLADGSPKIETYKVWLGPLLSVIELSAASRGGRDAPGPDPIRKGQCNAPLQRIKRRRQFRLHSSFEESSAFATRASRPDQLCEAILAAKMSLIALEEAFNIPSLAEQSAYQARLFVADGNGQAHADRLVDIHGERLVKMDQHGVAHTILSLTAPGIQDFDEPKAAAAAAKEVNDWVHQQVQQNPKRFSAFASLSMHNPKDASDELRRCVKELGFVGALVNDNQRLPNDEAAWYDQPEWDSFWKTVTELDVPFYLHPIAPKGEIHRRIYKDRAALIGPVLSFANNVSAHLLGMIVNGVFDRHPKLKIIVGHLGEHIPFDLWRINHWLEDVHKPRGAVSMQKTIRDYFNENIWVTTSGHFSTLTLKYVQDEIGIDRILFSIDYPYEKFEDACNWFKTLDGKFSAEDLAKISHENSQKLFPHLRS